MNPTDGTNDFASPSRQVPKRRPHCTTDESARLEKSRKIIAIMERRRSFAGAQVLDIGTGPGFMAAEWVQEVQPGGEVWAVDAQDLRETREGFHFRLVEDARLPFEDNRFDIVISNHVMEHVGEEADQIVHLSEIRRVLKSDGVGYLAVPNRWRLVEHHFRLPLLSWFPGKLADKYVKVAGKGDWYDVVPPSHGDALRLMRSAGLEWEDVTLEAMRMMAELEDVSAPARTILRAPSWAIRPFLGIVPTMIFVVRKPRTPARS